MCIRDSHRTKPLTLTEAGEEFLSCAEACLEARRRLDTKLSSIAQRDNQRIALGVPTGMPPPLLLSFLDYFRHIHPELTVTVAELPTRTGAFHEIPGHIDLVMGEFQGENSKLSYTSILHSEQFTVVPVSYTHLDVYKRQLLRPEGSAGAGQAAGTGLHPVRHAGQKPQIGRAHV